MNYTIKANIYLLIAKKNLIFVIKYLRTIFQIILFRNRIEVGRSIISTNDNAFHYKTVSVCHFVSCFVINSSYNATYTLISDRWR